MFWSKKHDFIEQERLGLKTLSEQDIEDALLQMASEPIHSYLLHLVDELVRQGVYLTQPEQEGAKLLVKILGTELQKAKELVEKKERSKKRMDKT